MTMAVAKTPSLGFTNWASEIDISRDRQISSLRVNRWGVVSKRPAILLLGFSIVFLLPMLTSASKTSTNDKQTPAGTPAIEDVLSNQQKLLIQKFGQPDNFQIAFEIDESAKEPKRASRVETWFYHRNLTSFDFVDGRFFGSRRIEMLPKRSLTAAYRPDQFQFGETIEQIGKVLKLEEQKLAKVAVDELGLETPLPKGLVLFYAPQLVMGFSENRLHFVQTITCSEVEKEDQK
jgi:hypothetical protein